MATPSVCQEVPVPVTVVLLPKAVPVVCKYLSALNPRIVFAFALLKSVELMNPFHVYTEVILLYSYKTIRRAVEDVARFSIANTQSIVELYVIACGYITGIFATTTYGVLEPMVPAVDERVIDVADVYAEIEYQVVILAGSVEPNPISIPIIEEVNAVLVPVTAVVDTATVPAIDTTSCIGVATPTGSGPTYLSVALVPVCCDIKVPRFVFVES